MSEMIENKKLGLVDATVILMTVLQRVGLVSLNQALAFAEIARSPQGVGEEGLMRAIGRQQGTVNKIVNKLHEKRLVKRSKELGAPGETRKYYFRYEISPRGMKILGEVAKLMKGGRG